MHKYVKAIGFHEIDSEKEWNHILSRAEEHFTDYDRIALEEGLDLCELRKSFGDKIGISSYGQVDEADERFRRESYFPYFEGSGISSYADIIVEQRSETHTYVGICEEMKIGISLIFHLQNGMEYQRELQSGNLPRRSTSITFSGLATSGKVLFPVLKSKEQAAQHAEERQNHMMLLSAAREGNPEAIESLTMEDIDTYTEVSRRIRNEDIYSIVDTSFMPDGLECDKYAVLGEILDVNMTENEWTGKMLYILRLEMNDLQFDVCVPAEKVVGEPAIGRRFKAKIWLQGHINF